LLSLFARAGAAKPHADVLAYLGIAAPLPTEAWRYLEAAPGDERAPLVRAFNDVKALFQGKYPGYLPCDTLYHDSRHTFDMTLATARLVEGHDRAHPGAEQLGGRRAMLGVVIALLHDSGYMRRASEADVENGAVFTKVHVSRSADFIATYLPKVGFAEEASLASRLVHFTGYEMDVDDIRVDDLRDRTVGCMVGAADLIGQMSDRMYLEKCREFLYREFVLGSIARETLPDGREIVRYTSPEDLNSRHFSRYMRSDIWPMRSAVPTMWPIRRSLGSDTLMSSTSIS
jgi:hypothetical protein